MGGAGAQLGLVAVRDVLVDFLVRARHYLVMADLDKGWPLERAAAIFANESGGLGRNAGKYLIATPGTTDQIVTQRQEQFVQPFLLRDAAAGIMQGILTELILKQRAHIVGILFPQRKDIDMNAWHRTVAHVLWVVNEHRMRTEENLLVLLRQASILDHLFPFQWMVVEKQQEQDDGQRETVGLRIGVRLAHHHFRSHVAAFAQDAGLGAGRSHIVVVANQHIAIGGIDEEIAVVQVLVAIARTVQATETVTDVDAGLYHRLHALELHLGQQEVAKLPIGGVTKFHQVAVTSLAVLLRQEERPKESRRRASLVNVMFQIIVEFLFAGLMIPLQA